MSHRFRITTYAALAAQVSTPELDAFVDSLCDPVFSPEYTVVKNWRAIEEYVLAMSGALPSEVQG